MARITKIQPRPNSFRVDNIIVDEYGEKIGAIGVPSITCWPATLTGKQVSATPALARLPRSLRWAGPR